MAIPAFFVLAFLVKKETVSGIMGNTQGVSSATSPPINPRKKSVIKPLLLALLACVAARSPQSFTGLFKSMVGINILFNVLCVVSASCSVSGTVKVSGTKLFPLATSYCKVSVNRGGTVPVNEIF